MQIAICDDDRDELAHISSIIDAYRKERCAPVVYKAFYSATELLATTKSGAYDLYLLDVLMPGVGGMEAAKEIRGFDMDAAIVFLTSSPEFAVESYKYKAQNYLLKPADTAQLYPVLDALLEKQQKPAEGMTIKTKNGIAHILFARLSHVEVLNKRVYFHLSDGSVRETAAPLVEFEKELLARPEFIRVHRAYIVNLWQVAELTAGEITTLAGKRLPVSRHNYPKVRDAYVEQRFCRGGNTL